ncbi:MAG TPA: hypothetical protein VH913_12300 [Hyphomicrobiaceae bacterium]|jgi:hypothetical protein
MLRRLFWTAAGIAGVTMAAAAQTLMTPNQIRSALFNGMSLLSWSEGTPAKYRWVFRHDGWWARETIDKSSPNMGGRWRLSNDGFCATPYGYLLGNPTTPNGPENCFVVRSLGSSKWAIAKVGSSEPPGVLISELAASESLFANANPSWVQAWKSETIVRAFQQNTLAPAPRFAEGFLAYIHQNSSELLARAYTEAAAALEREPPYKWMYPPRYVVTFDRTNYRPGESCTIRTVINRATGLGGAGYLLITRPIDRYQGCTRAGVGLDVAQASADNARYLIYLESLTASLREQAVDDTVSSDMATACDLVCRGDETCIQGPHGERQSVGHGTTARTTYVGSAATTSAFCTAIGNLQSALEQVHVKYAASLALDKAQRGPCGAPTYANYPWFGKGTGAQRATVEQLQLPAEACLETAHMDTNFPFQGMTRGELTLTLRYPVGRWASCFTELPLRSKQDCATQAVPIGGMRSMRATIVF